jgi:hypothetical protein
MMLFKSCLAALAIALSLAAQSAQAGGCLAKSTRFEDIVIALNKAPNCLNAMQVLEACGYEDSGGLSGDPDLCRRASGPVLDACEYVASRVVELNAIVEKKCKAEAAQSTQREAGEYQTVQHLERWPFRRFPPQHVKLMTQNHVFSLKRDPRPERSDQRQPN